MQQKTLLKTAAFLGLMVATIYGTMTIPPYLHYVKDQKARKAVQEQDMKKDEALRDVQMARIKRTREWAKAKNLSREEEANLVIAEARSSSKESNESAHSGYKIPMNPKALFER